MEGNNFLTADRLTNDIETKRTYETMKDQR